MKPVVSHHIGLRVTAEEHAKYMAQGGAKWFREKLAEVTCGTCKVPALDDTNETLRICADCRNYGNWEAK